MGLDQLAQTVPWLAIALGAVVLSTVLVRARLAIYVCFVGALAFGAYREQSWVLAAFAAVISVLLLVEERYPRHSNAGR